MLAEVSGSIQVGLAGLGSAIGVGLVGMKASEAVGRNPGAFGKIITLAVLGMALSEAIVFYALFLGGQSLNCRARSQPAPRPLSSPL